MRYLPALLCPTLLAGLSVLLSLTQRAGAHPWWSDSVVYMGLPLGLLLGAGASLWLRRGWRIGLLAVASLGAFGVAATGKARFAASYAEDALAGQMWYIGWIATCCCLAALLTATLWPRARSG